MIVKTNSPKSHVFINCLPESKNIFSQNVWKGIFSLTVLCYLLLIICHVNPVEATDGDFFKKGVAYDTGTYGSHPSKCGTPFDINISGTKEDQDEGTSLYAPEDGYVDKLSYSGPGGWGNNIYWTSDSGEKIFLAHLKEIRKTGRVKCGEKIGELGKSGGPWGAWNSAHLHIERCNGTLKLSDKTITASKTYTSQGPDCDSSDELPDLNVKRVEISEAGKNNWKHSITIESGQSFKYDIETEVENKGDGDTDDEIEVEYYISNDKNFDKDKDDRLGKDTIDELKEGEDEEEHLNNLQAPTSPGTYYIFVYIDYDKEEEHNSNNYSDDGDTEEYAVLTVTGVPPAVPSNVSATDGTYTDKVRVTWSASSKATSYQVYRSTSSGGAKTKVGSPSNTSYDDKPPSVGTKYYYWVKAKNAYGTSPYSSYNIGYRAGTPPPAPSNVSASDGSHLDKVSITWSASSKATSYQVYRSTSSSGAKSRIGSPSVTSYDDESASVGAKYYYWVRAKNQWGTSGYSSYDIGYRRNVAAIMAIIQNMFLSAETPSCPNCSGTNKTVRNVTFHSGTNCKCVGTKSLTVGPNVTIEKNAQVTFESPRIRFRSGVKAKKGSSVKIKQNTR